MGAILVSESIGMTVDRPVYSFKVTGLLLLTRGSLVTEEIAQKLKDHGVHVVCVSEVTNTLTTKESILDVINPVCFGIASIDAIHRFSELVIQTDSVIPLLNKLNNHDCVTLSHSLSVGVLMYDYYEKIGIIGDKMGLTGCLHDIGKLYIPADILNKPRKLSQNEFEFIKLHPSAGYTLLLEDTTISQLVNMETILLHHERTNGKGYPYGKNTIDKDFLITPLQMFDVFEALTSSRSYRVSASKERAIQILTEGIGVEFNEDIAKTVIKYLTERGIEQCTIRKAQVF